MLGERDILAFEALSGLMRGSHNPWWVIGPAAAALYGVGDGPLAAIDVLVSPGDARRISDTLTTEKHRRQGTPLLRARATLAATLADVPVEFHSWLEVRQGGGWQPFGLQSRAPVEIGDVLMPVPRREELADMLARYGGSKERALATRLAAG